jgi:hypothetical protein
MTTNNNKFLDNSLFCWQPLSDSSFVPHGTAPGSRGAALSGSEENSGGSDLSEKSMVGRVARAEPGTIAVFPEPGKSGTVEGKQERLCGGREKRRMPLLPGDWHVP